MWIDRRTGQAGQISPHPRALTRIEPAAAPIAQIIGDKAKPSRRWDSWYDKTIVTRAGEDILEEYDVWGIETLRRHHLVWSSWGPFAKLPPPYQDFGPFGMRVFHDIDRGRWRLFFASLLWRAAAISLKEFADVVLPTDDMEQRRLRRGHLCGWFKAEQWAHQRPSSGPKQLRSAPMTATPIIALWSTTTYFAVLNTVLGASARTVRDS